MVTLPALTPPESDEAYAMALWLVFRRRRVNCLTLQRDFWNLADFPIGTSHCENMLQRMAAEGIVSATPRPIDLRAVLARVH